MPEKVAAFAEPVKIHWFLSSPQKKRFLEENTSFVLCSGHLLVIFGAFFIFRLGQALTHPVTRDTEKSFFWWYLV